MTEKSIEKIIAEELRGDDRQTAEQFAAFLREEGMEFVRDRGYWRDKIYFLVQYRGDCICFIAVKDPEEPENRWTVWSDNLKEEYLSGEGMDEGMKRAAWKHVDECRRCGSCGGGSRRTIFGRAFDAVCGCTFRFVNPGAEDLSFLKEMVKLRKRQGLEQAARQKG